MKGKLRKLKMKMPPIMEYWVSLQNNKERNKYIDRIEKIIRSSLEYKDYINFLKENVGLNSCIFFNHISSGKKHVSVDMHHEPFTLYDYVNVVLKKYEEEGIPLDDLDIADEVMRLHYENAVGLVPLTKTAHEMVHNSDKLQVPITMCYGSYSNFLNEYADYIPDEMYAKLQKKIDFAKNLTEDAFDALTKEFTYIEIEGVSEPEKMDIQVETNMTA